MSTDWRDGMDEALYKNKSVDGAFVGVYRRRSDGKLRLEIRLYGESGATQRLNAQEARLLAKALNEGADELEQAEDGQ